MSELLEKCNKAHIINSHLNHYGVNYRHKQGNLLHALACRSIYNYTRSMNIFCTYIILIP